LLKAIVICVKMLLNICKLVMNKLKMHELCRTIMFKSGYKDMNLFEGMYLYINMKKGKLKL